MTGWRSLLSAGAPFGRWRSASSVGEANRRVGVAGSCRLADETERVRRRDARRPWSRGRSLLALTVGRDSDAPPLVAGCWDCGATVG